LQLVTELNLGRLGSHLMLKFWQLLKSLAQAKPLQVSHPEAQPQVV